MLQYCNIIKLDYPEENDSNITISLFHAIAISQYCDIMIFIELKQLQEVLYDKNESDFCC
jgi:hypothetical protein